MNNSRSVQNASVRTTEGQREGQPNLPSKNQRGVTRPDVVEGQAPFTPSPEPQKKRAGRPKGSKNKPKGVTSLLPAEMADNMLLEMKRSLPQEHYDYLKSVLKDGAAVSTKREMDVLILLLSRNLYPALIMESMVDDTEEEDDEDFFAEEGDEAPKKPAKKNKMRMPVFRKDVTERLKVLQTLLAQKEKSERQDADSGQEKPILTIVGRSGIDSERLRILVGVESGHMVGDPDEAPRQAIPPRTVSDSVPERPEHVPAGEQD